MPDIYNQQTISLLDSQTSNLPSGMIPSDPKLTENVLGLVQNAPLPPVSEVLIIDQKQELDKPENSSDLLAIEPDFQASKSYSSSLSETEKITSFDGMTDDDLLIGKVEDSEPQGLLGGEPGDTVIGTAGSDSSVNLSPEDTLLNNTELMPIKTEENQQFGGELSSAESLQKPQAEEANFPVILEEKVESSETKAAITPNTAAADEKTEKVQIEASITANSSVEEEIKLTLKPKEIVAVDSTEMFENKSHTEQQQISSESNQKPSETDPLPIKEENLLGVEEAISESLTDKLPELAVSSNLTENSLSEDQILPTTTNDISEQSAKEPLTTPLSLTEIETNNKPSENSSDPAIAVEETPSLTTKASENTTDIIPSSNGDELSETKEQLVTSSNQVTDAKNTADITTQLNSQESSEEVANKQSDVQTLTSSDPSVKDDREDAIAPTIMPVKPEEVEAFKSGVFTVGSSGEVGIDFLYDGGWYQGQLAIFSLEGMEQYQPGSPEFIKESALRASSNSELGYIAIDDLGEGARFIGVLGETNHNSGEYKAVKSFKLRPGSSFGIMLIPNNRVEEVAENPMVSGSARPLFSMTTANPNEAFHVGQIADVTGEGNTFVMEDMRADEWTDRDYNDLIFQVRGAIGKAALMDEVVAPEKDWRGADLGKALIAYAKAYVNPDFLETSDPVDSESENQENIGEPNSNNEEIVGAIPPRSPLSDSNNTDSIPSEKTETVSPEIPPDQLLSIADAKQLIESFDIMRSLGQEIPQELLELAEKSLANNQPFPPKVPATPSNSTDILTGEIIPQIPVASIPKLEILAPEFDRENQPLIGAIAPSDNQPQNWASALVKFVNTAVKSGQQNGIVNLNIDLTKSQNSGNDTGTTSLTIEEKAALLYARENKVLVIVPVGDTPGQISPLAEASKEFNNIITVGAAERVNDSVAISKGFAASPNSGSGSSLNIVAEVSNDNSSSTTVASAKITDTIAQVWAVNPQLNYTEVIDIVKRTATDLGQPNWDNLTGAGIANTEAAVWLAKATEAQPISSVTAPETLPKIAPITVQPLADVTLTPGQPSTNINLDHIFAGNSLTYEIIGGSSDFVNLKLTGGQLQLTGLARSGVKDVTIRAIDATGKSADTKFSVTNYYLEQSSAAALNNALTDLTSAIANNPEGLIAALSSDETENALNILSRTLEKNPQLIQLLSKPETLKNFGLDSNKVGTIQQLLQSPELAAEFGLNVPLGEALSNPDSTLLDSFLLNADEAVYLLPENAKQPKVGFIDFNEGNHIEKVTNAFASVNPLANYDQFNVIGGNWAEQLVKFVDRVKLAGEKHAIVNLSFDLSQLDDIGITTRYELTPAEQQAIHYAQENNILLMVASGNTGGVMSALGTASQKFDNIITVGAVNQFESKTDYSAYGKGLTLMAPGGSWQDDTHAFVGTSRATAYVSAAASLVWAANPDLSLQQVKQLLIDSAADLNAPGWDETTGFGLINVKEAIGRAQLIEPDLSEVTPVDFTTSLFSGEGRVKTLARPTSEETERAIAALQNIQESLLEQWQTLADLGNPALTLADLDAEVKQKIAAALEEYQQVSTDAGITTAQAQQWAEALALATQHYQIEKTRLQTLLQQQKEVQAQLAALGEQKSALETETQKMLADIQKQIGVAESDLAKAQAKLTNPFADADDNLQINPQPWQNAANKEQESVSNFREQANFQNAEVQRYNEGANSINPTRWQVVGSASRPSGRTQEIWGWGNDPNLLKQKTQLQLQGQISSQNVQVFQQLSEQAEQQNAALTQYAQFLENQQNLNVGNGNTNDANTVLELLKEQLSDQENIANNYQKLASLAEARRAQNQSSADWNNSQINRWQQVGTRRTGRSGSNTEPVYGWVHYPEHIAPRDQAQQLANQAAQERNIYQQLASQSQQQVDALREQARKLSERVKDWPVLQQGIEYEIDANELRFQAEKDLLALHTPVQQQKLETLNLQISQAEEQLQRLENQKIPTQQQATDLTENRLKETQTEVEAIQTQRAEAQKDLQNFLETAGFLLPYRERLAAVQKTVEQLETEKFDVQSVMQQLVTLMLQTPSDSLRQQLNYWSAHLATLNQELDWAKLQQDQLALAIADSPERLAISGLIKELEGATTGGLPLQRYLDFLHTVEGSGANFLEGFDNLPQRLADTKAEETQTQKDLDRLNREYRELGLQKANFVDNLIPGKEKEIAAKEQQIEGTESAIAQTQASLSSLQNQLTQTQDSLAQKSVEIQQQQGIIAATQSQISNVQNQITANTSEIQQQQSVAQGYQNQINQANAAVNSLEQQRQQHQANANYWNSQIYTWGVVSWNYDRCGNPTTPNYGWVYNPQAEANRNAEQAAANSYAQQRDAAQVNAVQLTATLQPKIAVNQQEIATLQQHQQSLNQQQQALNSQLASQQSQLQQLQKEQQAITQQVNNLQSQINQTQNQLNSLNTQLGNQQQQREDLIAQLAQLNQQKFDLEQKLIEKYREIELTDKYFQQVEAEVNRLQSRLDLLNKAGVLEEKYQQNWQSWQDATQALMTATQALLEIRKAGQPDRDRLALLQQQLKDAQATLEQVKSLQETITNTQKSLEFTKLQLGNQNLLLQSLIDHDNPLAAAERDALNQAAAHQQRIWQWNGSSYAYNAAEADAYRANLQQASFIADERNRAWQQRQETLAKINELNQKISQQQSDIAQKQSELAGLGQSIPQIESKITTIQGEINTVTKGLELLQVQENKQTQIIQGATTSTQNLASQLSQTTQLHSTALRQLIGFGILASESDVDFFATQVEPQVNTQLEQLNNVGKDLGNAIDSQNQQIANWEQELANTQDDVSKQALTNLIDKAKTQLGNLEALKASNQSNTNELKDLLNQATEALTPLRQTQELEIRQKLESNDGRLESLQSQLNSENVADAAIKSGTVLDHVLLADQINQDLRLGVTNWTEQLLAGNQQTKELVTQQQDLSNSVDELIAYINNNLAEPDGNYNRIHADLKDGITTLGVVEIRADELDTVFTSTEDAIERIKLRIEQDASLWEEIAPIAMRYGAESQELQEYQQQYQGILAAKAPQLAQAQTLLTNAEVLQKQANAESNRTAILTQQIANLKNTLPATIRAVLDNNSAFNRSNLLTVLLKNRYGNYSGIINQINSLQQQLQAAQNQSSALAQQATSLRTQADTLKQQVNENVNAEVKTLRSTFLQDYPDNGTAIDLLKAATLEGKNPNQEISKLLNSPSADVLLNAEAVEGRNPNQALFDKAKAEQASHEAQGYALLAQANWYEQQAAYNWAVSRKSGPYWTEWRRVCKKRFLRRKKCWDEAVTHVDYNWILWQQYSQIFPQLRAQGTAHLVEADKWRKEKERIEPLKNQWIAANDAANQAEPPIDEARNFFAELEAARESIPGDQVQLASLENLLPTIQKLLEEAEAEAAAQNAKVQQQWEEYDTNSEEYRAAIADILQRRGELNTKAIETQQQLADAERNVERQTVALSDELESTKVLATTLEQQRQSLQNQIITLQNQGVTGEILDDFNTNLVQVDRSLELLNNKAAILTAEQASLTQKRTMLTAQNEVILAEQRLLDAYIQDPDADYSNLQQQLDDARAALAEAQRLAEQAEAASQALTAPLQELKTDLLAQNDEHLKAAKEHQQILKALVEATQSNANYTLQAAQKQQEVNTLEFEILKRLQDATAAGYQEAQALLNVARSNDMATAAALYYRDYKDLASDKGGKCTPGLARPEDQILADRYYVEMLNNRELQRRAQAQADAFGAARRTAEAQMKTLQSQQETVAKLLNDLNAKVAETQEERETKTQELAIAQASLDGITRIREQTEQTFIQLVTLEKLNLAQAQLEQEIAQSHQAEIDEAVQERMERDRLELDRQRLETTAKIEQLKQLQAEDNLRQNLNQARGQLGLATLDPTEDPMQLQTQLAGLLTSLKDLESQQPDLPDDVKALLAEARGDIHEALQGKEAANIQESLLSAMDGMIGQIESYKSEINRIDLEEQWDNQLLQTAQGDLQGASQQFLEELQKSEQLSGEKQIIEPLYQEALIKISLAEQAVEISSELAQKGKEALEQIIERRVAERKARKKAFWNKILGIISGVIGLLSAITFFIPGLQPLSIILGAASAGINAIQSIINGDWLGGIFSIVMAGVNVVTAGMGNALTKGAQLAIKGLQSVATGAFNGVRSMMSGDNIMGFLQILGGVAGAVTSGLSSFFGQAASISQKMLVQVFNSLQNVPMMIYGGIQSIKNGDWFSAIGNIFNSVITLGTNFAGVFNSTAGKIFEYLGKIGNTGLAIGGAIKEGSIEGWLSGITSIIGMWGPDVVNLIDRLKGEPIDPNFYEFSEESMEESCG